MNLQKHCLSLLVISNGFTFAQAIQQQDQFFSSFHFAVHEENNALTERSQKLVRDEFANAFETFPELRGKAYQVRSGGNEVYFYITTDDDMRVPMQSAVASMVNHLNGRVLARGRSMFYKAALTKPIGGYLEVTMDESHTKLLSVSAQSVPLRDLLKEIKNQVGSISYLIPGECADQMVDWSFGEMGDADPKSVDSAMSEIAVLFGLKFEKKNGTYIFSGTCNDFRREHVKSPHEILGAAILPRSVRDNSPAGARVHQVFMPVFPFGE